MFWTIFFAVILAVLVIRFWPVIIVICLIPVGIVLNLYQNYRINWNELTELFFLWFKTFSKLMLIIFGIGIILAVISLL